MERLYDILDSLDVVVEYSDLSALGRDGDYDHELRLIRLQSGMAVRRERWVLAHETAHAFFGDELTMFARLNDRQERRADEWAARQLVAIDRYREAEFSRNGHVPSMAYDLGVVTETVEVFQRTLTRVGDTVYVKPRMGLGQWCQRADA